MERAARDQRQLAIRVAAFFPAELGDATMHTVIPFRRPPSLRREEDVLLERLQSGVVFAFHDGRAVPRKAHGIVVFKGGRAVGICDLPNFFGPRLA